MPRDNNDLDEYFGSSYSGNGSSGYRWTEDDFRSFEKKPRSVYQSQGKKRTTVQRPRGQAASNTREVRQRPAPQQREQQRRKRPQPKPRPEPRQRSHKPMSKGLKRFLIVFGLLTAIGVTILIGVFLVFKVENIVITGDKLYNDADIIKVCGYSKGENLFFLSTTDKEEKLSNELPYIEKAVITRKIPSTVEINITAVKVVASIAYEDKYVYVDKASKVIEVRDEARENTMLVKGLPLSRPSLGSVLVIEDEFAEKAFTEIIDRIGTLEASAEITELDMTDIYNITASYENRIKFILGNTAELGHKIEFGLSAVRDTTKVPETGRGTLDLSLCHENNRATYNATYSGAPQSTGDTTNTQTFEFANNAGRGSDIPNAPYTGQKTESSDSSGESDTDGSSSDGDDNSSDESYDDSDDYDNDDSGDYDDSDNTDEDY